LNHKAFSDTNDKARPDGGGVDTKGLPGNQPLIGAGPAPHHVGLPAYEPRDALFRAIGRTRSAAA